MFDVLAQTPTFVAYLLAGLGSVGLISGLFLGSVTRPKSRPRRVAVVLTVLGTLAAVTSLTVQAAWEDAKWEAVTATVNEKYGIELSVDEVAGLSVNSANWLTIHGDRVACVFEYEVSNTNSADPAVGDVHLVCGDEVATAG